MKSQQLLQMKHLKPCDLPLCKGGPQPHRRQRKQRGLDHLQILEVKSIKTGDDERL